MGDVSRIELFARESAKGWEALGNEIGSRLDIREALPTLVTALEGKRVAVPRGKR
jgi:hypothetical protein